MSDTGTKAKQRVVFDIADAMNIAAQWLRDNASLTALDYDGIDQIEHSIMLVGVSVVGPEFTVMLCPKNKDVLVEIAARLKGFTKKWRAEDLVVEGVISTNPRVVIAASIDREHVCVRKQVGMRMVNRPDPNAQRIEVEEPVYKWDCPGSILAKSKTDE